MPAFLQRSITARARATQGPMAHGHGATRLAAVRGCCNGRSRSEAPPCPTQISTGIRHRAAPPRSYKSPAPPLRKTRSPPLHHHSPNQAPVHTLHRAATRASDRPGSLSSAPLPPRALVRARLGWAGLVWLSVDAAAGPRPQPPLPRLLPLPPRRRGRLNARTPHAVLTPTKRKTKAF